ncbi:haloacid dehalogenase-like hydrolase [Streptomyces sp. SID8375]|uniref:haloacid dehalogenase-like hydrolase n=1 Tax=unclassified Streptomyces TaxID=2593676 RepID=UPI00037DE107|nr:MULTISPECIES: haloacid dehalogenase-like hydrolase [unclassified Streptomyces]MYX10135.1 haloacid dehalogenase-like hydrolase [Streptomyces sp. SID8375]
MLSKRRWLAAGAALAVAGGGLVAAQTATAGPAPRKCPTLKVTKGWYGKNRAALQKMIDERGTCAGSGGARPVATFDWDNTVVKNDVSDATLAWALRHDKVLQPKSWKATNKWLTADAHRALTKACGTSVPAGRPLPTSKNTACTDEILDVYQDAETSTGKKAFTGTWNHRRTVPEYVWITQLFAGHSPATLTSYARQARAENLKAPIGTEQTVGTHKMAGYIRYYVQQKDLIRTLKAAGFDVYIVSASAEPIVRAWAPGVGLDRDHVIGIRNLVDDGRLTTGVQGCGDVKATHGEVLTYMDGKRCWINQEIYGVKGAKAWQQQDRAHRPAFAAGDAETDVTFVGDATGAHLALNRNKAEFMCRAYDNSDHRWLVNPMFIEPNERQADPYPCATTGYTRPDGTLGPVRRADGSIVPDQQDRIHG